MELKKIGSLPLSKYSEVWTVLFLVLGAISISEKSSGIPYLQKFTKLNALKSAVKEFYADGFSPEIVKAMDFIESSERSLAILAKYIGNEMKASAGISSQIKESFSKFQINLMNIKIGMQSILSSLKLTEDYIIFIDGLDVRPPDIEYQEYFSCVRGIIEAIWSINSDFLSNIKDSKGRIRFVVLIRPDIFLNSGLHNTNTKIMDNSVFLNWRTTHENYRSSHLFAIADRMLSVQNDDERLLLGDAWDYYFKFEQASINTGDKMIDSKISSFLEFLMLSYYRPRDINSMMTTMKDVLSRKGETQQVARIDFDNPAFMDSHSNYLLGEIRDQLLFYYNEEDYIIFISFFQYLDGKRKFSYGEFSSAFTRFTSDMRSEGRTIPAFFNSINGFLQFLYDQNIICYLEDEEKWGSGGRFVRWCFRERSTSNLSPQVKYHTNYEIFYGLSKALNVGLPVKMGSRYNKREIGTVCKIKKDKKFGFIRGGAQQEEYFFHFTELSRDFSPRIGDRVSFVPSMVNGKSRALSVKKA